MIRYGNKGSKLDQFFDGKQLKIVKTNTISKGIFGLNSFCIFHSDWISRFENHRINVCPECFHRSHPVALPAGQAHRDRCTT